MVITKLLLNTIKPEARAFEASTKDPLKTQSKVLAGYIRRNRSTEYGRRYGFSGIRSIGDYRARVPICDYEGLRRYVDRIIDGEKGILTRDDVVHFALTSGTTNKPKYIPSTLYSESKKAQQLRIWTYYAFRDYPAMTRGRVLVLVSAEVEGRTRSGVPYGSASGRGYNSLPFFVRGIYTLPGRVFDIKDHDARYYSILRLALEEDVRFIVTLNPYLLVLLSRKLQGWAGLLIDDIAKGAISGSFNIEKGIRKFLEKRLRPDAARALKLKKILKERGSLLPKYAWEDLALIGCWKSGAMSSYIKSLIPLFGDVPVRDMGFISTEARSSVAFSDDSYCGALAVGTNFYEFAVPQPDGKIENTLLAHEVKEGREYLVIVTTASGLYRYNTDDIIRVTGFFNKTPIVEFVRTAGGATSLADEAIYESHVSAALAIAQERHAITVEFLCAVACAKDGPRYAFLAEFSRGISREDKKDFLKTLDNELKLQNALYKYSRDAQLIKPPVLKVISPGGFEKYRAGRISQGAPDGQFKPPLLTSEPVFAENFEYCDEVSLED